MEERFSHEFSFPARKASLRSRKEVRDQEKRGLDAATRAWFRRRAGRDDWAEGCTFGIRERGRASGRVDGEQQGAADFASFKSSPSRRRAVTAGDRSHVTRRDDPS